MRSFSPAAIMITLCMLAGCATVEGDSSSISLRSENREIRAWLLTEVPIGSTRREVHEFNLRHGYARTDSLKAPFLPGRSQIRGYLGYYLFGNGPSAIYVEVFWVFNNNSLTDIEVSKYQE